MLRQKSAPVADMNSFADQENSVVVVKEGWMLKADASALRKPKKFYFVLNRATLQLEYYDKPAGKIAGAFSLISTATCEVVGTADPCSFLMTHINTHKVRRLKADTVKEMNAWVSMISNVIYQSSLHEVSAKLESAKHSAPYFEFIAHGCNLRAPVLETLLEGTPMKFALDVSESNYGSDGARCFAKHCRLGVWPHCRGLVIDCGPQIESLLGLVMSLLNRTEGGAFPMLSIVMKGMNTVVADALLAEQRRLRAAGFVENHLSNVFTPTAIPPLELALMMAAHCRVWYSRLPMFADALGKYVDSFDKHAARLLDQCNTEVETERILIASNIYLDGGSPIVDFIAAKGLVHAASNRWVQLYIDNVWTSYDLRLRPSNSFSVAECDPPPRHP